jgi:beta-phosphoglucomutase
VNGSSYDAVLFDFDGVIVDSEPVHFACWRQLLETVDIRIGWDFYQAECVGIAERAMLDVIARHAGRPEMTDRLLDLYPLKKVLFRHKMAELLPVSPGISALLAQLRGYRIAVVTSSGREEVQPILEQAGLMKSLDLLVCGHEAGALKPSPAPYLLAAERIEARRPLVVEDSETGEKSGRAAGFDVLRVNRPSEVAEAVRGRLRLGE